MANLSINTEVKADMKLEGSIHVVSESKNRKGGGGGETSHNSLLNNQASQPDYMTPAKNEKNSVEKDLGTTNLRKTVFKKHYS